MILMFFLGASTVMVGFCCYFIYVPVASGNPDYTTIEHTMPIIRTAFIIMFIIFSSGLAVQIMQSKGINYLYIMDCDPHHKMTHY